MKKIDPYLAGLAVFFGLNVLMAQTPSTNAPLVAPVVTNVPVVVPLPPLTNSPALNTNAPVPLLVMTPTPSISIGWSYPSNALTPDLIFRVYSFTPGTNSTVVTNVVTMMVTNTTPQTFVVSTNLMTNGSFENGATSWTWAGNVATSPAGSQGAYGARFNAGQAPANGIVSQNFATVAGHPYVLSFDCGIMAYNGSVQALDVTVRGLGRLVHDTVQLTGDGSGKLRWLTKAYPFVADTGVATVTFADFSPSTLDLDMFLDVVTVKGDILVPNSQIVTVNPTTTTTVSTNLGGGGWTLLSEWPWTARVAPVPYQPGLTFYAMTASNSTAVSSLPQAPPAAVAVLMETSK